MIDCIGQDAEQGSVHDRKRERLNVQQRSKLLTGKPPIGRAKHGARLATRQQQRHARNRIVHTGQHLITGYNRAALQKGGVCVTQRIKL